MSEELNTLVDVTIKSVKAGPSGETEHGTWQIHNVILEGYKEKFTYFEKDGEMIPEPGMKIRVFDYESEQKGKYMNHTIKRLTYADGEKHNPKTDTEVPKRVPRGMSAPQNYDPGAVTMHQSYYKDIICAMIRSGVPGPDTLDQMHQIAREVMEESVKTGIRSYNFLSRGGSKSKPVEIPEGTHPSNGSEPEDPFGEMQ